MILRFFDFTFSSGQEVQRISVINNLPDLLRDSHADCMRRVVPKVRVSQICVFATKLMVIPDELSL